MFAYVFTIFACFDSGLLICCLFVGCQYCFLLLIPRVRLLEVNKGSQFGAKKESLEVQKETTRVDF